MRRLSLLTTRRYRGRGEDLLVGVLFNVLSALLVFVFHQIHGAFDELPKFFLRDHFDFCIPLGLFVSWLSITVLSYKKNPEAMNPLPAEGDSYVSGPLPNRTLGLWYSYGFIFNLQMISIGLGLAGYFGNGAFDSFLWMNSLQPMLVASFWITAFTYLPVLGLARSGGPKKYWIKHRHLFVFPVSVALHGTVFCFLIHFGLGLLFPNAAPSSGRSVDFTAAGLSAILGFFSAIPVYRIYERAAFGRNLSTDPKKIRNRSV